MPKKKTPTSTALVPVGQTRTYPIAGTAIEATQLFRVPERHPRGDGPWTHEPDKIAWTDPASGLPCTILRATDGTLGGYVGVGEEHSLHGFQVDAVPSALGISPHGGLDHASSCQSGPEETSICHPEDFERDRGRAGRRASLSEGEGDAPLWWFGFSCDKNHDLVPGRQVSSDDLGAENGRVYRDEAYVYRQTTALARQLAALTKAEGEGGTPLDQSSSSPPVGLDPERRS